MGSSAGRDESPIETGDDGACGHHASGQLDGAESSLISLTACFPYVTKQSEQLRPRREKGVLGSEKERER